MRREIVGIVRAQRALLLLPLALVALLVTSLLAACGALNYGPATGGSGSNTTTGSAGAGIVGTTTATVSGHSETILTDSQGHSLYYHDDDTSTTSTCTTGCSGTWPPLTVSSGTPTSTSALPGTLSAQDVGNGMQVLYNLHPLYRYSGDTAAGQTNGDGIDGKWHVATPDVASNAGPSTQPVSTQPASTPCTSYYCGG